MKNMTLMIKVLTLVLFSFKVMALPLNSDIFSDLKTFTGQPIKIDKEKTTHLVFIDLWRSYEGQGDEKIIASLPTSYLTQSQQIWIQPEVNVTKAHLVDFQQYYPQVTPLVFDQKFALMRALKIWQSPYHVLIKEDKQIFSGDASALLAFITNNNSVPKNSIVQIIPPKLTPKEFVKSKPMSNAKKPMAGDKAPYFSATTLTGTSITLDTILLKLDNEQPLNLVFLDALCPMPQFPGCEGKLKALNTLIERDSSRQWIGVINSYYVNDEYAQDFAKKFALKFPLVFDHDNTIFRAFDVYASPYQIKIDRHAMIKSRSALLN